MTLAKEFKLNIFHYCCWLLSVVVVAAVSMNIQLQFSYSYKILFPSYCKDFQYFYYYYYYVYIFAVLYPLLDLTYYVHNKQHQFFPLNNPRKVMYSDVKLLGTGYCIILLTFKHQLKK